jgi:glycosyltransferase involved in cell wall biosynthesis
MKLSVIITTYNSKEWLKKVLFGYSFQTDKDFEIVIADDGSSQTTKDLIDTFKDKFKFPIIHVWQADKGFRKSKVLNKAILKTNSDYLVFTDGDCIPRKDFIENHLKHKEEGYFLSGGYFKLPLSISTIISENDIEKQKCFSIKWLLKQKLSINFKLSKLLHLKQITAFLNWITPTKRSFNGHNSSAFKSDILKVNGFNEEMQYGGLDRELGERLQNNGLMSKQIRYSAICLHLDHERSYATQETWAANNVIRDYNKKNKVTYIKRGIDQYSIKND